MSSYEDIYTVVRQVPHGQVSTYGRIALLAGLPRQARRVGYALHNLHHSSDTPWWRIVNAAGRISNPYAIDLQRARLEAEGVVVDSFDRVDLKQYLWEGEEPE